MGKTTNILIPSLISLFNDYNNNLRTRLKADTLFLSFDERSKKTFNKFINLSNDRFKLMKYGWQLNNIISNQKSNYSKLNNDIQNDLLFNTNYSNIERKKLIKSVNEFKSKEIYKVRDKLFETLKQRTAIDIMLRQKQILLRKEKNEKNKFYKRFNSPSKIEHKPTVNENEKKNVFGNKVESIVNYVNDTIKDDHNHFMTGMELYKNLLKSKKNGLNDNECKNINNNRVIKISKGEFSDIETHLNENNIKVLSYNEDNLNKVEKKKNEDEKFDINCLYKLKNSNNYFNKGDNNNNNNNFIKNQKRDLFPKLTINPNTFYKIPAKENKKNIKFLTFHNYDAKNTIKLIKKEAFNGVNLGERFKNQKEKFDTYYGSHSPKRNLTKSNKIIKNKKFQRLIKENVRGKTQIIKKKRKLSNYEKILEDFRKIYDDKKVIWKKEDKEKEIIEKNNEKKEEDIINFLLNLEDRDKNKKQSNK